MDILVVAKNPLAPYDFILHQRFEAGLSLLGSEVKSIRAKEIALKDSFVLSRGTELFLHNAHIGSYKSAGIFGHKVNRDRKLLLHRREINKIIGFITRKGMTAVPLMLYINKKGLVKLSFALGEGKKTIDKRQAIKEREWKREAQSLLKTKQQDF